MKITVKQKNPRRGWLYPVCPKAYMFLELLSSASHTERKAITPSEIELIEQLGFEVEVQGRE